MLKVWLELDGEAALYLLASPVKVAVIVSDFTELGAVAVVLYVPETTEGLLFANVVPETEVRVTVTPLMLLLGTVKSVTVPDTVKVVPHGWLGIGLSVTLVSCFVPENDLAVLSEANVAEVPAK
jgi:hypothetical protein